MAVGNIKAKNNMTTKSKITFIIFTICLTTIIKGQSVSDISYYAEKGNIKSDTLVDKTTGCKFIIDKQRIYITAIDKTGKLIWKTDPAVDNKLEEYRIKRPTIVYFNFGTDRTKERNEVISISYNNSQFGNLDKRTGELFFEGQD